MNEETKPKSADPMGAATYIETVYGTKTFARALTLDDAQSIMDLMNDFSHHNSKSLQSRISELEAEIDLIRISNALMKGIQEDQNSEIDTYKNALQSTVNFCQQWCQTPEDIEIVKNAKSILNQD